MNKVKGIIISSLITIFIASILTVNFLYEETYDTPTYMYQVYLDGKKIGLIDSRDELYDLINEEQIEIKNEYKVNQVYPPKGFQIIRKNTYDEELSTVRNIYESIKDEKQFTIKGYTITIKNSEEDVEPIYIYVLDKTVFEKAVDNIVKIFIGEERYEQYLNDTQPEIVDTGYIIDTMYFQDNISIKESFISVDEQIHTDVEELTRYLLFGNNVSMKEYTVVQGDTIEKIAEANQLNTDELLIANQELKSEDTLLAIGQKLNVALINPVLSLTYDEYVVVDNEIFYQTEYQDDPTQYVGYTKTIQNGVNGINRGTYMIQFMNGEQNQGGIPVGDTQIIKPVQNEIIARGTKKYENNNNSYPPVETGGQWYWPTNQPYIITSGYEYRWGSLHNGLDISGTGRRSPIYASLGGVVISSQYGGIVGSNSGCNVVIEHSNGYYTVYAHLEYNNSTRTCTNLVHVGDIVSRGQQIGLMGSSGYTTGVHLHFSVWVGKPYGGGYTINPWRLWGR